MTTRKTSQFLRTYALNLSRLEKSQILKKLGIKQYDKNILSMSNAELLEKFGKGPKSLNKSLFIKNVIWETYGKLMLGQKPFDIGNLRSFWYYIKDTMDRVGATKKGNATSSSRICSWSWSKPAFSNTKTSVSMTTTRATAGMPGNTRISS